MPTQIPGGEKAAFIAIVNVRNPTEAVRLATILVNYEDVPTAIGRQLEDYSENPQYLNECLAVLDNNNLQAAKVYFNYNQVGNTNDPLLWVNSSGPVTVTQNNAGIGLLGASSISLLTVNTNITLSNLYVGPGSTVNLLDATATGSFVANIYVRNIRNNPGTLSGIKFGSTAGTPVVDEGAYYGGIVSIDPATPCANPVTGMAASRPTNNSVLISWVPPVGGYLSIDIFYKKLDSKTWLGVTDDDGDYVTDNTGFIFRHLPADTWFDFKVVVECTAGGFANTTITTQTVCCSPGTQLTVYKACKIDVYIKDAPDPTQTQTLCNGVVLAKEYPSGSTLTIPYLVGGGKNILAPFLVDNTNANDVTFNPLTATWDASTSTIVSFSQPMHIEINVNIPA